MPIYIYAIAALRTLMLWPLIEIYERYATKEGSLECFILVVLMWSFQEVFERRFQNWIDYKARLTSTKYWHKLTKADILPKDYVLFQMGFKHRCWLYGFQVRLVYLLGNIIAAIASLYYVSAWIALAWISVIISLIPLFKKQMESVSRLFDEQQEQITQQCNACQKVSTLEEKLKNLPSIIGVEWKQSFLNFKISATMNIILIAVAALVSLVNPDKMIYIAYLVAGANKSIPALFQRKLDIEFANKAISKCQKMLEKGGEEENINLNTNWD